MLCLWPFLCPCLFVLCVSVLVLLCFFFVLFCRCRVHWFFFSRCAGRASKFVLTRHAPAWWTAAAAGARRAAAAWRRAPTPAAAAAATRGWQRPRHADGGGTRGGAGGGRHPPTPPMRPPCSPACIGPLRAPCGRPPRRPVAAAGWGRPARVSAAAAWRRPPPGAAPAVRIRQTAGGATARLWANPAADSPDARRAQPRGWAGARNEKPSHRQGALRHTSGHRGGAHERDGTRAAARRGGQTWCPWPTACVFTGKHGPHLVRWRWVDLQAGPSSGRRVAVHNTPERHAAPLRRPCKPVTGERCAPARPWHSRVLVAGALAESPGCVRIARRRALPNPRVETL